MPSAQQLVFIAVQIARGLQQLHRRKLLHRDVAARNCLSVHCSTALSRCFFSSQKCSVNDVKQQEKCQ